VVIVDRPVFHLVSSPQTPRSINVIL
jgi:hypothetical protein